MKLNLAEKYTLNAINNQLPLKEVVIDLCDIFLKTENDNESKLDLFLKSNLLNKKCLKINLSKKEFNKIYENGENLDFLDKEISFYYKFLYLYYFYNEFELINAISKTFNIDFKIANQLKKHQLFYKIELKLDQYFLKNDRLKNIDILYKKLNYFLEQNNDLDDYLNNLYNNINFTNNQLLYIFYKNILNEFINDLNKDFNFDLIKNATNYNLNETTFEENFYIFYTLKYFDFELIKKSIFNEKLNKYQTQIILINSNNLEEGD